MLDLMKRLTGIVWKGLHRYGWEILLVSVLVLGALLRTVGLDWGEGNHLHPDERFVTWVTSDMRPVDSISAYFDTANSTLNPHNLGHGFFVYGTWPLFMARAVGEALGQVGFGESEMVGRTLSALFDTLTILLVYWLARTLYRKDGLAVLAAALYAFAVLPIQAAHFYTVDSNLVFFITLGLLLAAKAAVRTAKPAALDPLDYMGGSTPTRRVIEWVRKHSSLLALYALFGVALGMAVASKVSAAPLAAVLPMAAWVYYQALPRETRSTQAGALVAAVALAAVVSLVTFRILNPYAFMGPGFFGLSINERWLANLKEISVLSSGAAEFPPALQWANRPITFALENIIVWGLGLPLGLAAWTSFGWMGWRIFRNKQNQHLVVWAWTALVFVWQSLNFTRAMRYQLPIYPALAVIAAWGLVEFLRWAWQRRAASAAWLRGIAVGLVLITLIGTAAWAFAFTRIYTRPITRLAASDWIYQNVPAAITIPIEGETGVTNQPVAYQLGDTISAEKPMVLSYRPRADGNLQRIEFTFATDMAATGRVKSLFVDVVDVASGETLGSAFLQSDFAYTGGDPRGQKAEVTFGQELPVLEDKEYRLIVRLAEADEHITVYGPINLTLSGQDGEQWDWLPEPVYALTVDAPFVNTFNAIETGDVREVRLNRVVDRSGAAGVKTLKVTLTDDSGGAQSALVKSDFLAKTDPRGESAVVKLAVPFKVEKGRSYTLTLTLESGEGQIGLHAAKQVFESSWDDPLPYSRYGIDWNGYTGGVFRTDLNLELYWDDNAEKLERIVTALDQADYIYLSSNRQWGTTVRVPERYPLTTEYYRLLLGCPADEDVLDCYRKAEPGMYRGELGYELHQVFASYPNLGGLTFNSQYAEEAFSVYDHPKVMIFKKTAQFDSRQVRALLEKVDLSRIVRGNPTGTDNSTEKTLLLNEEQSAAQLAGGTWSELFDRNAWFNRYPGLGAVLWYLFLAGLGWIVYPFTRLVFRGLPDLAYPISRMVGLILLAYCSWLAASNGLKFTRGTILAVLAVLVVINAGLILVNRKTILAEVKTRLGSIAAAELLILLFFLLDLGLRYGNGDLWHPAFGGEKPMDFSYFNAVLKSTVFPPYDPWFTGGYINYYYFGFVLVGTPVKLLGIVPSIAYNLILPTLFSLGAASIFSLVFNLFKQTVHRSLVSLRAVLTSKPFVAGALAAIFVYILGNQGTLKMVADGLTRLGAPGGVIDPAGLFEKIGWFFKGIGQYFSGMSLPYSTGDWYWIPSRAIPFGEITEFPFFTFLYADLHAHMVALPVTGVALLWALSVYLGGSAFIRPVDWKKLALAVVTLLFGGVVIGSLRPLNTWDLPTYLGIASAALVFAVVKSTDFFGFSDWRIRLAGGLAAAGLLGLISFAAYEPYSRWYAQGYNAFDLWKGPYTPLNAFLTHWGLFLFILVTWLVVESVEWMAVTPASSLRRLQPYKSALIAAGIALALVVVVLLAVGVNIAWIVVPVGIWIVVLLLRPGLDPGKRAVLFIAGCALFLMLMVELVTLRGDIGRMNTVFKFYLQAWVLLGAAAAAGLVWLWPKRWRSDSRSIGRGVWLFVFTFLAFNALLYPLKAGASKVQDRMAPEAPRRLDGMEYMLYSGYSENGLDMRLAQDYHAIRWMQDTVQGSPVILEANIPEYRWGSRYTINTGLPGVVGWNWHQRQQRSIFGSDPVSLRVEEITRFYASSDRVEVEAFLSKYNIRYVVVGQLEKAVYPSEGLAKFDLWRDELWRVAYQFEDTTIYEVIQR